MGNKCSRKEGRIIYKHGYDYDLVVIGGGSGGISAAKEASRLGQKVCLCDYVVPSPMGTKWGLGGTCLNVGCVPKKLLHSVALVTETLQLAPSLGFSSVNSILKKGSDPTAITRRPEHDWNNMIENVQTYIHSINWKNRLTLREHEIDYKNAFAVFLDPHTLELTKIDESGDKEITTITGNHILIAIGGRPNYLKIPGGRKEDGICISSDDLFSLPYPPGKTLIVGASYIALECAGFLVGLGFDVTIMVRSILLRGFDQEMAEKIGDHLVELGVRILRGYEPTEIKQLEKGLPPKIHVRAKNSKSSNTHDDTYNTVLLAIGRRPNTFTLHPENAEVKLDFRTEKVIVDKYEQTNKSNIFSVGDCAERRPELASVAIIAGKLLSERLYSGSKRTVEYKNVPTTIFTPLEYGCIGLSEEDAILKFGRSKLTIYHNNFQPMEYVIPQKYPKTCHIKLICLKNKKEEVVGLHYFGPNGGEVTQGFALGFKFKAKKSDYDRTIGIHPTCAEKFTLMNVQKGDGQTEEDDNC